MRFATFLLVPAALLPTLAIAADDGQTQCTYNELVRRVVIMSEPGVSVPCEVHYYKDSEAPGEDQVLWSADSQAGYCEEKAAELIAKLEGWGWQCDAGAAAPEAAEEPEAPEAPETPETPETPEAPMEPADDTQDLAPADDK
jgi:hypothetical protein